MILPEDHPNGNWKFRLNEVGYQLNIVIVYSFREYKVIMCLFRPKQIGKHDILVCNWMNCLKGIGEFLKWFNEFKCTLN